MSWGFYLLYFFCLFLFYFMVLYGYYGYLLIMMLMEGVFLILYFFYSYLIMIYMFSLDLLFLFVGMMVFEGVIGLCLLINNYRFIGLGYYFMW